ncbi:MAG: hypothetical protein QM308_07850 [Bacillota bacterium]|nr:hypothetical protein [Bacillota bacterium]
MKKRILSVLLASLMLVGLLPIISVLAGPPTNVGCTTLQQTVFVGDTITWTVSADVTPKDNYQTRIDVVVNGVTEFNEPFNGKKGPAQHSHVAMIAGKTQAKGYAQDLGDNTIASVLSASVDVKLKPGPVVTSVSSINHTALTVKWAAITGAAGYKIFTSANPAGPYTLKRYATGTSAPISFLTPGQRVFIKVSAYIESNGTKYDLTEQGPYKIGVPVGTASITKIENYAAGRVRLTWKVAPGATGYEVWRSTSPTTGFVRIRNANITSHIDTNLVRGRSYYYKIMPYARIFAVNYYGQWSMLRSIRLTK